MFKSVGHFFTSVGKSVVHAARLVSQNAPRIAADAAKAAPIVEAITSVIYPPATAAEDLAFRLLGAGCQAVHDADQAVAANGLNLQLDAQTYAEIKALLPQLEQFAKQIGAQKPSTLTAAAGQ